VSCLGFHPYPRSVEELFPILLFELLGQQLKQYAGFEVCFYFSSSYHLIISNQPLGFVVVLIVLSPLCLTVLLACEYVLSLFPSRRRSYHPHFSVASLANLDDSGHVRLSSEKYWL
jgi:hypothetical protein